MITVLTYLALITIAIHLFRQYWFDKSLPQVHSMNFDGELFHIGETSIAIKRPAGTATKTLICFPGFLEDQRYFLALYDEGGYVDKGYELILVNNANYHSPFIQKNVTPLQWDYNPYPVGTIEHDGFIVAQVVKKLPHSSDIFIHGHSRGGAVVLEAGRQFPELMKSDENNITAILEAAVVPQGTQATGTPHPIITSLTLYLLPLVFGLSRNISDRRLQKLPMMKPTTPVKTHLIKTIFCNTKSYATCVENFRNIIEWQQQTFYDLYQNYDNIVVLIGERDDVLSVETMKASAIEGAKLNQNLTIIETTETNHFISLEKPETVAGIVN
ncbi:MAG: alpha/beta hydrolase [Oceanicoccus sp.]